MEARIHPIDFRVRSTVLVSNDQQPFVRIDGPQTENEFRRWTTWEGQNNVFSLTSFVLSWQGFELASMPSNYNQERWRELWGNKGERFLGNIRFANWPSVERLLTEVEPSDFRLQNVDLEMLGPKLDEVGPRSVKKQ
jgi:hypothetical protein